MSIGKKYSLFSMNVTLKNSFDDGIIYPHMWINYNKLLEYINSEGYKFVKYVPFSYWRFEGTWIDQKSAGIFVCKKN